MKPRTRSAFTLIELLVLFAVVAFLIGLLLPAIQKVREAAARMQSQNNLKQLAIGCHAYTDANKNFPSGADMNGFSAAARLLPYVEQNNLYQQIQFNIPARAQANAAVRKTRIPLFLSPLDPLSNQPTPSGPTNYLFSAGTKYSLDNNNGMFFKDSKVGFAQITDGLSNTIMIGETLLGDGSDKAKHVGRQHVLLDPMDLAKLNDNSGVQEFANNKNIAGNRGFTWLEGKFLQTMFTGTRAINDAKPDVDCGGAGGLSALRGYGQGVNVAMGDGSVRYVNTTVQLQTWQAMCTRDGGEVIPNN